MEVAAIIIRNEEGELFAHQRSNDRRMYPGLYGLGAGGKIAQGETPQQGAQRELNEETGITAVPTELFAFDFADDLSRYRMHVFELITNEQVKIDAREWQWGGWLNVEQVTELDNQHKLCPDTSIFFRRYIGSTLLG